MTTPDIEKLRKLIARWRGEVIRWHDAGFFMRSDTFADCANELEIALEEEELPTEKQKGIRGVICD